MEEQSLNFSVTTRPATRPLLDTVFRRTETYMKQHSKEFRKPYGQFFTGAEAAAFMADLFDIPETCSHLRILDPGAGSGILSAALIQRLQRCPNLKTIHLVCYELDPCILGLLRTNLDWMTRQSSIRLECRVIEGNYILSDECLKRNFDLVIANPPYRKLSAHAPEALKMADVCHGAPNLYFLFASLSLSHLRDGGQMVYLLPHSWTSGAYFQRFRKTFLQQGALEHLHLFESRSRVFAHENVLQETMILKASKTSRPPPFLTVTSTRAGQDFAERSFFRVPYHVAVSGQQCYVRPVRNQREADALRRVQSLTNTLPDLGLKMKTGLTVEFRCRQRLRDRPDSDAAPLFYPAHIRNRQVRFPIGQKGEFLSADGDSLLQRNENYLFLKRFTSKEEPRRLQCGVYLARRCPSYARISTQNKLNFIGGAQPLSECAVYGLYVLFNSTLYDCCYRILDGSTQVNASEINALPVPTMECIQAMGRLLMETMDMSVKNSDRILENFL